MVISHTYLVALDECCSTPIRKDPSSVLWDSCPTTPGRHTHVLIYVYTYRIYVYTRTHTYVYIYIYTYF